MTRNQACSKNKEGKVIHSLTEKTDGEGRTFISCDKCHTMPVTLKRKK